MACDLSHGESVTKVYNPFCLMHALDITRFKNFWFESETPTFLVKILKKEYRNFDPDDIHVSESVLGRFDIDTIPLTSLMFQTGYLTIKGYDPRSKLYSLGYPNKEIEASLQIYLEIYVHMPILRKIYLKKYTYRALENLINRKPGLFRITYAMTLLP